MSEFTDHEIAVAESAALDGQIDDYLTGEWERRRLDSLTTPDDEEPNREAPPLTDLDHHLADLRHTDYLDALDAALPNVALRGRAPR